MAAPPLADPSELPPPPDGTFAATTVAGTGAATGLKGDGAARESGEVAASKSAPPAAGSRVQTALSRGEEELERGWTGLGLPAYEEPAPAAKSPAAKEPATSATASPAPAPPARDEGAGAAKEPSETRDAALAKEVTLAREAAAAREEARDSSTASPPNEVEPAHDAATSEDDAPPRKDVGAPAVKAPKIAVRAQHGQAPRPTGKSGAFAAVRMTPGPPPVAAARQSIPQPERQSIPHPERQSIPHPERQSVPHPEAAPARKSAPHPAPAPRPTPREPLPPRPSQQAAPAQAAAPQAAPSPHAASAHAAAPQAAPAQAVAPDATAAAPKPARSAAAPLEAAPRVAAPDVAPPDIPAEDTEDRDVTFEDEGELGATIPEEPRFFADLSATVPMLPHAQRAPSFGLPPPDAPLPAAGAPARPVARTEPMPGQHAAPAAKPSAPEGPADDAESGPPPYGPGAIIGDKYRLIRIIGRGGMGAVWIAHNSALDVEVAIKLMRRDRATPEAAARFTTEARAAARLGHSSIVRVFDFGETSRGDPFIVMELLHGESFGALLARKKKLSPTVAVQTLLPVAHALAAAHAKGIVHRDLKPDNILLAKDETNVVTPKVVDFGIAKLSADVDRHFTIAGEVLGSPDYMSPEQARGEDDIDHRTDIWTFTVLLYEAVSGKRPFDGANYNALLASIIASKPAPIMDHGIQEPGLWAILEKGLSKERDGRWQSVREMGMELARWAIERGAEHDLAGASLSAQWMEPTRRRLFTVAGSAPPPADSTPATEPQIPKPPPLGGLAAEVPKPEAPATTATMPPFVPRRRPWLTLAALALALGALAYGLVWGGVFQSPPEPAASGPPRSDVAPPPATVTESPTVSPAPSVTATSTAKPSSSAKTRPIGTAVPGRPRAPQVKGDIKF